MHNKRKIIYTLSALISLLVVYWAYSHSFIKVVPSNGSAPYTYFFNSEATQSNSKAVSDTNYKKLVSKNNYEISVQSSDNKSYFAVIGSSSFLRTKTVDAALEPEKTRSFIGNNPATCAYLVNGILVTLTCGDYYGNIRLHLPSTDSRPTYVSKVQNAHASGVVEGIINIDNKSYAMIYGTTDEEMPPDHSLYQIDSDFGLINKQTLKDLDYKTGYKIEPSAGGFIAYSNDLSKAFYYKSLAASPVSLKIVSPKSANVNRIKIHYTSDKHLVLYAADQALSSKQVSELVLTTNNSDTHNYTFKNKSYSEALFCGNDSVCLLDKNGELDIFSLSSKKVLYSLNNVSGINNGSGNTILLVNNYGVARFDVNSRVGYYEYSLGSYKFTGLSAAGENYILSLNDNKNRGVALLIQPAIKDVDSIDKKVSQLQKLDVVSFVSTNGRYIYISANMGEPVYDKASKSFVDNPATKKAAAQKINQEIDRLGIDRSKYVITSNAF